MACVAALRHPRWPSWQRRASGGGAGVALAVRVSAGRLTAAEERDRIVGPDGADLPPGSGNAAEGAIVFERRGCSICHGPTGEEGPSISLVGGDVTTRTNYWPIRHWPFAPSIWDYIRRVMPYDRPGILSDDETYAVTAYLLYRNDIISEEAVMDAESLPRIRMPSRDDYVMPGPWTPETRRGLPQPDGALELARTPERPAPARRPIRRSVIGRRALDGDITCAG